jgi:hypothetical protein
MSNNPIINNILQIIIITKTIIKIKVLDLLINYQEVKVSKILMIIVNMIITKSIIVILTTKIILQEIIKLWQLKVLKKIQHN